MKRATLLLAAALTACGGAPITAEQVRGALPHPENARVGAPGQAAALTVAPSAREASAVSNSGFFLMTTALAASVNVGVGVTLVILRAIVELPPTHCSGDTCTWGPGAGPLDPNLMKLEVTKVGDHYEYALSGEPKTRPGSGFVTFLSGSAFPGAAPRRGHGTLTLDFDAAATLDGPHGDDTGRIEVAYDARTSLSLDVLFLGMVDRDAASPAGSKVNAAYAFEAGASGGDLQVAWRTLPPNTEKTLSLHSRWDATGAGRGDARFTMPGLEYVESECWGPGSSAFALVYDTNPPIGAEAACAFAPAAYATLVAP
jgi:hypothetical protein